MPVTPAWDVLRARALAVPGLLATSAARCCVVCRAPVRGGYERCYQCQEHRLLAPGLLADVVAPVGYALTGTLLGRRLLGYKEMVRPANWLLAVLLGFLQDHGGCVARAAGMRAPGYLAVVPSGYGRPGPHPLLSLVSPYLRLPLAHLVLRAGAQGRRLDPHRFAATVPAGVNVLLLDDAWVSGASAQSAAVALKLAGAAKVATVVVARMLNPAEPGVRAMAAKPYDPASCVVHCPASCVVR